MALDTETKRRSMIAIPGVGTLPVADLSIDSADRRHFCDVYAGFPSVIGTFFFWRKRSLATPAWIPEDAPPTSPFVSDKHRSDTWVSEVAPASADFEKDTKGDSGWVQDQDNPEA